MAAYIQAVNKQTDLAENFSEIDEKICAFLGVDVDPRNYCADWYNMILERLAYGAKFEKINEDLTKSLNERPERFTPIYAALLKISAWLEENYTFTTW